MVDLVLVGIVAGFLAGISPCILPVLPVVLVAGAAPPLNPEPPAAGAGGSARGGGGDRTGRAGLAQPLAVVAGLVLSFSLLVLAGSEIISLFHLPQDFAARRGHRAAGLVGLGYLIPPLAALIERPFARLGTRRRAARPGGFVLGLALGVVYVPCAGPILAAITVVGATHRVGLTRGLLTAAFAVGTAVPLLAVAIAGRPAHRADRRPPPAAPAGPPRRRGGAHRHGRGDRVQPLRRAAADVPGYTSALQSSAAASASSSARSPETRTPRWPSATPTPPRWSTAARRRTSTASPPG